MGEFSTRPPHAPIAPRQTRSFDRHVGKGFIVTGAAGGIGQAAAALLIDEGAHVVLTDVRRDALDAALASLDKSRAFAATLNAADPASGPVFAVDAPGLPGSNVTTFVGNSNTQIGEGVRARGARRAGGAALGVADA